MTRSMKMGSSLFEEILRKSGSKGDLKGPSSALLEDVWPTLVGEELSRKLRPIEWDAGCLKVIVIDEAWQKALRRQQGRLRARIQRFFPWPIKRLQWSVAPEGDPLFPNAQPSPTQEGFAIAPGEVDEDDLDEEVLASLDVFDTDTRQTLLKIRAMAAMSRESRGSEGDEEP